MLLSQIHFPSHFSSFFFFLKYPLSFFDRKAQDLKYNQPFQIVLFVACIFIVQERLEEEVSLKHYFVLKPGFCHPLVSHPGRWSFSLLLGPLHWSSSRQWQPCIAGCKLFPILLWTKLADFAQFVCKIYLLGAVHILRNTNLGSQETPPSPL